MELTWPPSDWWVGNVHRVDRLDKEMTGQGGPGEGDCTVLLMGLSLKLGIVYSWNFPFTIFRLQLTMGNGNCGK